MKVGDLVRGTNGYGLGVILKIKAGRLRAFPPPDDLIYKVRFLKTGKWLWLTDAWLEVISENR